MSETGSATARDVSVISVGRTLEYITPLLEELDKRVKVALLASKPLPITPLARDLAPVFHIEWNEVYHLINVYVAAHSDTIMVRRGIYGGIIWKKDSK